ncbi:MAG TPA: hypothetical protein VMF89_08650, partial [Polyangiales bacterium]|nr:hypothetical protein [Polyangiales bacterium]
MIGSLFGLLRLLRGSSAHLRGRQAAGAFYAGCRERRGHCLLFALRVVALLLRQNLVGAYLRRSQLLIENGRLRRDLFRTQRNFRTDRLQVDCRYGIVELRQLGIERMSLDDLVHA